MSHMLLFCCMIFKWEKAYKIICEEIWTIICTIFAYIALMQCGSFDMLYTMILLLIAMGIRLFCGICFRVYVCLHLSHSGLSPWKRSLFICYLFCMSMWHVCVVLGRMCAYLMWNGTSKLKFSLKIWGESQLGWSDLGPSIKYQEVKRSYFTAKPLCVIQPKRGGSAIQQTQQTCQSLYFNCTFHFM